MQDKSIACFSLSAHAKTRIQQRGITANAIGHILTFGQPFHAGSGCLTHVITKKLQKRFAKAEPYLSEFTSIAVVVGPGRIIITVEHLHGSLPKHWKLAKGMGGVQ